ncbi:enolase C-terminal domain-like protein [Microbacterium rhizosphaerae]|uniref:glucarate dehydratase n=1 Tax=Microbacterium rhizosphaerae TaxID=1678237 RepID=A0ABZ0SKZ9_9MICO|nr:enolase C-terminal domain-like protein [Microbacterium rhizosphaerae]WPR90072.1 enolase C-terminal domain-like protein [Microbacterium rhizosphaerae]
MIIQDLIVTPIAFPDPPLLNAAGVHEPLALRSVVQLVVAGGVVGLGEGWGERDVVEAMTCARDELVGQNVFDLAAVEAAVGRSISARDQGADTRLQTIVFAPIEVACHDAQGKILGVPVSTLLGGAVRDSVDFSGYLFYKWDRHLGTAAAPDRWGAALDPAGIVDQARTMIDEFGFRSLKLKAGVFHPDEEAAAIEALAEAFPGTPLRMDPNGVWSVETSVAIAERLRGTLQYLEDPTMGMAGMSAVAQDAGIPLATNMCVVGFDQIAEAVRTDAVQIILSDHHFWGGLRRTRELGVICETFGLGLSMHSNSHLGISLAAMTHVAAAMPRIDYACDTHYPWNGEHDILEPGAIEIRDGAVRVPTGPGLGVELDEGRLGELHALYTASGRTHRDDEAYMQAAQPDFVDVRPRF